jgi:peptidyl-prolyl cis-trans isomerase B (cyclophilin B)
MHTCFGKVTKGVEVVDKIKAGDKIVSIEVQD